jgi:hypothetical protein
MSDKFETKAEKSEKAKADKTDPAVLNGPGADEASVGARSDSAAARMADAVAKAGPPERHIAQDPNAPNPPAVPPAPATPTKPYRLKRGAKPARGHADGEVFPLTEAQAVAWADRYEPA